MGQIWQAIDIRNKKITWLCVAVIIVLVIVGLIMNQMHKDSQTEQMYRTAISAFEAGDYNRASELFVQIKGYKDVDSIIYDNDCLQFVVGNTVAFGHYEQDNNTSNGPEEIAWIVLDADEDKALLICKYALDCAQFCYHWNRTGDVDWFDDWDTCSLREWLNSEFLNNAFSSIEQGKLISYNTGATSDLVFLLNSNEANRYLNNNKTRACEPTPYANWHGASKGYDGTCWWWLRSTTDDHRYIATIERDGSISMERQFDSDGAVRPVIVLKH